MEAKGLEILVFSIVENAAKNGKRCPTNPQIAQQINKSVRNKNLVPSSIPAILRGLSRKGYITVRVYGANWRDVLILKGEHKGTATMPPPHGGKPYIVIDPEERLRRDNRTRNTG